MHIKNGHTGVQFILSTLREKFWIIRRRKTIKKIISKCIVCKRFKEKALQRPMAALPESRIGLGKPFPITGVDLLGPLYLKDGRKKTSKIGDIVLIGLENIKRMFWPKGRKVELISGKDGIARVAHVKTSTGVLVRAIQRLYPLDISSNEGKDQSDKLSLYSKSDIILRRGPETLPGNYKRRDKEIYGKPLVEFKETERAQVEKKPLEVEESERAQVERNPVEIEEREKAKVGKGVIGRIAGYFLQLR
ncbi:hypothetical protein LAZ67_X002734 [Cordylochernes scorpioides]|uniref:Integrase zinc-binding domain-containing protein n=1 Tax=Cordylochernes scorpioides TaxID=51811 RepID=A0ABY6LVR0_9ARAC|nr:hypothetical protein LAZ67_X002734 [Cordylochernes scorpioides]